MYGTRRLEEGIPMVAGASTGFDDGGYVVKLNADPDQDQVLKTAAITDAAFGVVVDDTKNPTTDQVENGKRVTVLRHGVVAVKSEAVTWKMGQTAYLAATDGYVTNVDGGSAVAIGMYVGEHSLVAAAGDKVEIDLDASVSEL